ncbi:GTP cyclohydrolase, FolE2/MptA family, partial [candidate division CSSED10-310 bacterium]
MKPLVSIIITTRNRPQLVRAAIESVLQDEYPHKEIIVVDDCSETATAFIEHEYPDVQLVVTPKRSGVGYARNLGLNRSRGHYITFLDDDDISYPEKISLLMETAEKTGSAFVFGRTIKKFTCQDKRDVCIPEMDFCDNGQVYGVPTHDFLLRMPSHNNGILVKRQDLIKVGGYAEDVDYFDDWAAWLKMFASGIKPVFVPQKVAEFRFNAAGLSHEVNAKNSLGSVIRRFYQKALSYFDDDWPSRAVIFSILADIEEVTFQDYDHYVAYILQHKDRYLQNRSLFTASFPQSREPSLHQALSIDAETIRQKMVDPPEIVPEHNIEINRVGIVDQNFYLTLADADGEKQFYTTINVSVNLPASFRGIHMSRIVGRIDRLSRIVWVHPLDFLEKLKNAVIQDQHGARSYIDMTMRFPLKKLLPESEREFTQQFLFHFGVEEKLYYSGLTVPHITACPCIQCYSECVNDYSSSKVPEKITHSQR